MSQFLGYILSKPTKVFYNPALGEMSGFLVHHFPLHSLLSTGLSVFFQENQGLTYLRAFAHTHTHKNTNTQVSPSREPQPVYP